LRKYIDIEILNPYKALGIYLTFISIFIFFAFFFNAYIKANNIIYISLLVFVVLAYFLFSYLIKKLLVKKTTLLLGNESLIINDDKETIIVFEIIDKYYIETLNGAKVKLWLNDDTVIVLQSNHYFCNNSLERFAKDFKSAIEKWSEKNNEIIKRKKSFFDYKLTLIIIVLLTLSILFALMYSILIGRSVPNSIFGALASLTIMWGSYFSFRNKN